MKFLITGATGLIGLSILKQAIENNNKVNYLTTRRKKLNSIPGANGFYWQPKKQEIDIRCFEEVDTIIHLSGESISKKWSKKNKKEILESRILSTRLLKNGLEKTLNRKISNIICSSAIGVYPNSLDEVFDEKTKIIQNNFLQEIVIKWEKELQKLSSLTKNFSIIRIGLVLSLNGGILPRLALPVRLFIGAAFGSGKQWQSWIHLSDLTRMFLECSENEWYGLFNAVSPNPVTQRDFLKELGQSINRPVFFPNIPSSIIKLILGERSILVLGSQKVSCDLIIEKGFSFKYNKIDEALEDIYKKV